MTPGGLTLAAACSFSRACLNSPVIRCKTDSQGGAIDLGEGSPFLLLSGAGSERWPFNHTPISLSQQAMVACPPV
jgi:hypothetical protein